MLRLLPAEPVPEGQYFNFHVINPLFVICLLLCHCLLITLLISRLFHCAAKCRIIQQEYDTKTSKMFQSSHKMFQFVNLAELFYRKMVREIRTNHQKYLTFYNQIDRQQHIYSTEW